MIGASKVYDQLIKDNQIETNANQKNLVTELDKFLSNNKKNFVQNLKLMTQVFQWLDLLVPL